MKEFREGSGLFYAIWRDKGGWQYKIEKRGPKPLSWASGGFDTQEAATMAMNEKARGILDCK